MATKTNASKPKTPKSKFTKETYLHWYEMMLLIRKFEEKAGQLYGQQKIRGFLHLYIGQEAVAAGSISATRPEDPFVTAYRDHGLAIAKGVSANSCMAELFGKATGCSAGKGGSMHMFGKEERFFGGHGIVGGQIGVGAGLALAEQYKGTDNVVLCFFGDGAARQGIVHETFNMASLWNLPVVFICENNNYAMGTSVARTSKVSDIYKFGTIYGMHCDKVDGMTPESVHEGIEAAVNYTRAGKGPSFLEIHTYRYKGHSASDPATYRSKEEVEKYKAEDPIETTRTKMQKLFGISDEEIDEIDERVKAQVDECVQFAEDSPFPEESDLLKHIYAEDDYPFITD